MVHRNRWFYRSLKNCGSFHGFLLTFTRSGIGYVPWISPDDLPRSIPPVVLERWLRESHRKTMGKYGGLPSYHQSLASGERLLFFFELEAMAMASLLIYSANGWMFHSFFVCLPDTRLAISHIIYYIHNMYYK